MFVCAPLKLASVLHSRFNRDTLSPPKLASNIPIDVTSLHQALARSLATEKHPNFRYFSCDKFQLGLLGIIHSVSLSTLGVAPMLSERPCEVER